MIAVLKNPFYAGVYVYGKLPRCMTFGGPRVDAAVSRELKEGAHNDSRIRVPTNYIPILV